jgi:multidrug resistance efflux pump
VTARAAAALLAAALALGGCRKPGQKPELRTHTVARRTIEIVHEEVGVLEARRQVEILAPFRGKLLDILPSGSPVKAGDVIATLDTTEFRKSIEDAAVQLVQLQNERRRIAEQLTMDVRGAALDVDRAATELDLQRLRLEQVLQELASVQVLRGEEVVAGEELENAESKSESSRLNTRSRDLQLRSQKTDAARTEIGQLTDLERKRLQTQRQLDVFRDSRMRLEASAVKAPVDGLFYRQTDWNWQRGGRVEVQAGDEVNWGDPLGRIPDLTEFVMRSQVSESRFTRMSEGMAVQLVFDTLGGRTAASRVTRIGRAAIERERSAAAGLGRTDAYSGERVFEVEIAVPDGVASGLRPGITARVRYVLEQRADVVAVPLAAVWTRAGEHLVAVRDAAGAWQERAVKVGLHSDGFVEVTEGLQPGDTILADDPRRVLVPGLAGEGT